jgi:hypothetical protein
MIASSLLILLSVFIAAIVITFLDLLLFWIFANRKFRLLLGILIPAASVGWFLASLAPLLASEESSPPTLIEIVEFVSLPTLGVAILSTLIALGLERTYKK